MTSLQTPSRGAVGARILEPPPEGRGGGGLGWVRVGVPEYTGRPQVCTQGVPEYTVGLCPLFPPQFEAFCAGGLAPGWSLTVQGHADAGEDK